MFGRARGGGGGGGCNDDDDDDDDDDNNDDDEYDSFCRAVCLKLIESDTNHTMLSQFHPPSTHTNYILHFHLNVILSSSQSSEFPFFPDV